MDPYFEDWRLEDSEQLAMADPALRWLAGAGARIRMTAADMGSAGPVDPLLDAFAAGGRPRGVVVVGAEARLIRAVLEPVCPVPLMAWPFGNLPGWVGPLDLVVVLASQGSTPALLAVVAEARRRGVALLVAAAADSPLAEQAGSRSTLLLPVHIPDPLSTAVGMLECLHRLGLGPVVSPESVAVAVDAVAEESSPHVDLARNPAKDLALGLAEALPLVWGGTVLAARASRRVAEALRRASGRPALAADATDLLPLIESAEQRDPFADPFGDESTTMRPVLVILDDQADDVDAVRVRGTLAASAQEHDVRVCEVQVEPAPQSVEAYAALLMKGLFGATYLQVGLGATPDAP